MPFKRAGWLQRDGDDDAVSVEGFQCPLSGLVGCNERTTPMETLRQSFNAL